MTPKSSNGKNSTVLLVEDDELLRETICDIIEMGGFCVVAASNGREALNLLYAGCRPHAIILDLMMPVMNGWQFRKAQLEAPELREIPVVVVTGAGLISAETYLLQPVEFLVKPFEAGRLVATISRIIGRPTNPRP